jgi:pyridoxine 5-phosphate synthase
MAHLGMNIDHVATIRQARRTYEPDPIWAAVQAQLAGAECITIHLREDRRHINDADVRKLVEVVQVKLNLEMAATDEMVAIASKMGPQMATLVPEGRLEVTTEGGLDVKGQLARLTEVNARLKETGVSPSAFIDAEPEQIEAAAAAGFEWCEIHTGPYAHAFHAVRGDLRDPALAAELDRVRQAGSQITAAGMRFNAGHALNYVNVKPIAVLTEVQELHIGHSIIARAVFVGLDQAIREMRELIGG